MRLFVSYARVDKSYCIQIVDTLDVHETWYDQRLYAGQHWWREILRRLDWCQGFVYLLSPDSINSNYCRKEYDLAKSLGRHIFPVVIRETSPLPDSLGELQYANFTKGITSEAVKVLLNSIYIAERQSDPLPSVASIPPEEIKQPAFNSATVIRVAATAMENGQFDQAVFLLKQAKSSGYTSRFINIDAILQEAETALERQAYLIEAEREYKQIAELVKYKRTNKLGWEAFQAFRQQFPDYDPDCLAEKVPVAEAVGETPAVVAVQVNRAPVTITVTPPPPAFVLPLLEWCNIPGGQVEVVELDQDGHPKKRLVTVETFQISKYPVTNAQFQAFVEDPNGYANPAWWHDSDAAIEWRKKNTQVKLSKFKGSERPREMVSWYEAIAFCNWLSASAGYKVILPATAQWQRAFQGEDGRPFPWGKTFDKNLCNTFESEIKMTTLVTRYSEGISPYGVYDMAGNVWEWCSDIVQTNDAKVADQKRIVRGGSFISPYQRAHVGFQYHLTPESYHASIGFRLARTR